jgi:hypothetical protein
MPAPTFPPAAPALIAALRAGPYAGRGGLSALAAALQVRPATVAAWGTGRRAPSHRYRRTLQGLWLATCVPYPRRDTQGQGTGAPVASALEVAAGAPPGTLTQGAATGAGDAPQGAAHLESAPAAGGSGDGRTQGPPQG